MKVKVKAAHRRAARIKTAHVRADCALLCATLIAILSAIPALAYNLYTDDHAHLLPMPAAQPIQITQSPVELAAAGLAAEQSCLAEAMYYEARGEGLQGQEAIAEVVLQRTHNINYPKTVCGVVHQGAGLRTGCQFTYVCDGSLSRPKELGVWRRVRSLASQIMTGAVRLGDLTGHATNFHTVDVQPAWTDSLIQTTQIGNHIFYKRGS